MKSNSSNTSFIYLKIFMIIFLILTIGTIFIRSYHLFRNKTYDSRFYSVALIGEKNTEIMVVRQSNAELGISKLYIENTNKSLDGKTLFEKSVVLGVPLSAAVKTDHGSSELFSVSSVLSHLFGKKEQASLRISDIDYLYIARASQKASNENMVEKKVQFEDLQKRSIDPKELAELFRSDDIVNQKLSVSVINSSGMPGVARSVANMLEMTGYYVISVDSSDLQTNTSVEVSSADDYFIFTYLFDTEPTISEGNRLEDVKINVGKDAFGNL